MTPETFTDRLYALFMRHETDKMTHLGYEISSRDGHYRIELASGRVSARYSYARFEWWWDDEPTDYQMAELALIL